MLTAEMWAGMVAENAALQTKLATAEKEFEAKHAKLVEVADKLREAMAENEKLKSEPRCDKALCYTLHDACLERDALREECEKLRMQLAGCGVAAMTNTASTAAARITKDNPYWSASYGDVCAAVDREVALREENEKMSALLHRCKIEICGQWPGSRLAEDLEVMDAQPTETSDTKSLPCSTEQPASEIGTVSLPKEGV